MNQGRLDEAKRTFLTCAEIPDENLKDPHTHKSSVTSCLYNLGKLLHEQGHQEVGKGSRQGCTHTHTYTGRHTPNVFTGTHTLIIYKQVKKCIRSEIVEIVRRKAPPPTDLLH
jgi:hypothetical protein